MTALLVISGRAYLAVSGVDVAIELNARLVLVRQLMQCSRVTVAHPPMPHVGVYHGAIDVYCVQAHVVEDDIYHVHPRYRRLYGKSISMAESRWGRQQITFYALLGQSFDRKDVRA